MSFYGENAYNRCFYDADPYRLGTELTYTVCARIVKPYVEPPPVMDTLAYGLAQRFNYLQQAIQVFGLFNKLEYQKGTDLDNNFGKVYELPRLTGEIDEDYRARLKTYVKVLVGSGTTANTATVLDMLLGIDGVSRIESLWPARAIVTFTSVDAMRQARAKSTLLNSVLPGMFAAGVDYEVQLPFLDCLVAATIQGDAELEVTHHAAIQAELELPCTIDTLIGYGVELETTVLAAIQAELGLPCNIRAALRADRLQTCLQHVAIQGDIALIVSQMVAVQAQVEKYDTILAAIQGEMQLDIAQRAAIQRDFELWCSVRVRCALCGLLEQRVVAAVQATRELTNKVRVMIHEAS